MASEPVSTVPATTNDRYGTLSRLRTVKDQIAPDATDEELVYFAEVCAKTGLSWFHGQIVLVPRWDSRLNRNVHRAQITVEGRTAIAARTGELVQIDGPYWTAPRDKSGALHWLDLWDQDETPPYAARVFVHRAGWTGPANGTVKWSEFAQTTVDKKTGERKLKAQWADMPSHMLGKTALSLALRRAFPEVSQAVAEIESDDALEPVSPGWDTGPPEAPVEADVQEDRGQPPMDPGDVRLDGYPLTGQLIADADWWRERASRAGVTHARLLRYARDLAGELGIDPPRRSAEIIDPELVRRLVNWLSDQIPAP